MIPRMGNSYPRLGFEMASPDGGRFGLPRFPEGSGNSRANHATLLSELIKSDVRPNDGQKDGRGSTAGEVQNMGKFFTAIILRNRASPYGGGPTVVFRSIRKISGNSRVARMSPFAR